jgi:LSD1 subclass zinc finger protein
MRESHLDGEGVVFTEQQLELLKKHWPEPDVVPGGCREALMYAAGAAQVVRFVERRTQAYRRVQI